MAKILDLASFRLLAAATARCGADLNTLLAEVDVQFSPAGGGLRELSLEEIDKLLTALEAASSAQHFPFAFAEVFNFDGQPDIAAFLVSANNLREAGDLLDWVPELVHPAVRFDRLDEGRWASAVIHVDDPEGRYTDMPALVELVAAVDAHLIRTAGPESGLIHAVHFTHAARLDPARYEAFFGCPVTFSSDDSRVIQDSRMLDIKLPGSLPSIHAQAGDSIRQKLLGDGVAPPLELQVADLLRQHPKMLGDGIEAVAKALRLSPRTLQRQLRNDGHSYSELLARTRHTVAKEMLRDTGLDIDSIGYKLGFSDRRSFTQAFKKWQGQTPSAYRKLVQSR